MKLFFLSSSGDASAGRSNVPKKKNKKKSKRPLSLSLSNPPSVARSSTSSDSATTPTTVLHLPRRPSLIGRNASFLDAEYDSAQELGSTSTTSSSSSSLRRGGDGKFTREELELVLRRLGGGREEDVAEMLAEADRNGDGRISLEELPVVQDTSEEEELRVAFGVYDANGDGKISAEELWGVFRMMGDKSCSIDDCRRMIGGVDSDGDGFVCFRDFANMMSNAAR